MVIGIELITARIPSAKLVFSTGEWGPIAAMVITFLSALFIPLQDTIFLGAGLSLLLYVVASSRKLRLQEGVRQEHGIGKAQKAGGTLAVPKMPIPGIGWLAYCIDPDGNIFGLLQEDRDAR